MEKNFEFLNLEKLKEKIETTKENLEGKEKKLETEKELIREELKKQILKFQQKPSFAPPPSKIDEVRELENLEKSQQIGALIEITLEKGLEKGVNLAKALAKKLKNPALLDEYHDVLVDRYLEILEKKGFLKNKE
jgi:hypothetical protein